MPIVLPVNSCNSDRMPRPDHLCSGRRRIQSTIPRVWARIMAITLSARHTLCVPRALVSSTSLSTNSGMARYALTPVLEDWIHLRSLAARNISRFIPPK